MAELNKIAYLLERFKIALNAHDRENPTHTAWGIGLNHFDMERLGLDDGEEILPGIVLQADQGERGSFRVLGDGLHGEEEEVEEEEVIDAVARDEIAEPA